VIVLPRWQTLTGLNRGRRGTSRVKVAVADLAASIATAQVGDEPEHAPLQEPKREPLAATAVSRTVVPASYSSRQSAPQSMPGRLRKVPVPVPPLATVSP
jgi:hypothetical protein